MNLNGYSIVGMADPANSSEAGIECRNAENATITNGSVLGYESGIKLAGVCPGAEISHMHIYNNSAYGIRSVGSRNDISISNNRISQIGGSTNGDSVYGIYVTLADGVVITSNTIDTITASNAGLSTGIKLINITGGHIIGNRISNLIVDTGSEVPIRTTFGDAVIIRGNSISAVSGGTAISTVSTSNSICVDNITIGYTTTMSSCTDGGGNYP